MAVKNDFDLIQSAAEKLDVPALHRAYLSLQSDVAKAQAYRPIPDAEAQTDWSAALTSYAASAKHGAQATVGGTIGSVNVELLNQATTEATEGQAYVQALTARISRFTR
jgi:hypothetical protein